MSLAENWVVCCDCKRMVKSKDTQVWVDMPEVLERLRGQAVSHGYCPKCFDDAIAKLDALDQPAGKL